MSIEPLPPALSPLQSTAPAAAAVLSAPQRWSSTVLLGQRREVLIDHRGEQYRLRLTAAGKLILTK